MCAKILFTLKADTCTHCVQCGVTAEPLLADKQNRDGKSRSRSSKDDYIRLRRVGNRAGMRSSHAEGYMAGPPFGAIGLELGCLEIGRVELIKSRMFVIQ